MNIWKELPSKETLLEEIDRKRDAYIPKVNAHMHTPYSFSAFDNISQALDMAADERVPVVGINDFYSTDGYGEWAKGCLERGLFPLFNIEFISLNAEDQANSIRVNDPNNPGRIYLSGKGLAFPQNLGEPYLSQLQKVKEESNLHVDRMCSRLNEVLQSLHADFELSFHEIKATMTKGVVRERHLARALREIISKRFTDSKKQIAFYEELFGRPMQSPLGNFAAVENEIRGNLLKAGGKAFVQEDQKAFLDMETVCQFIIKSGGIPTYPFLADDAKDNFTDFENDLVKAVETLKKRNIYSVEFIPTRNSLATLESYADYLYNEGFIVTFGSEHNTPAMEPITLYARNKTQLSNKLLEINYKGVCVIAAHQYLYSTEKTGYIDKHGIADLNNRTYYEKMGDAIIKHITEE